MTMDELRLILLLIGAAVIAGIYAWTRLQVRPRKAKTRPVATNRELPDSPDDDAIREELQRMQQVMSGQQEESRAPTDESQLLVISVVAAADQPFSGDALRKAFANNELFFGEKSIFHRLVRRNGEDVSVFGVANMFKPGDFGSGDLTGFETLGITLFLELPAPVDGLDAFDDFMQTAERLAVELGGQLQDQKHCVVTHQALMQKREALLKSPMRAPLAS
jgi:cell division protein ZipA